MAKSIIVIGAGIAGLSAGCYGQMNDYRTQIFELHDKPGGLCTSWKRKDYTFDGCIHWLVGSAPGNSFYRIWEELGAVQGRRIVDHEEFVRYEGTGGKTLILYTDIDRLEQHMKELAPGDAAVIEEFAGAVRKLARFDMTIDSLGLLDLVKMGLRMIPLLSTFRRYGKVSIQDFAKRFNDAFLREA
ncbi:MAG: NAD(P)-binding protein [Bacillota bacterium]